MSEEHQKREEPEETVESLANIIKRMNENPQVETDLEDWHLRKVL